MITKPKKNTVKQSQDFKSYSFGIKKEGLSHIFNVLRNQLYSDKVLAVIREYSTNAIDAHTEVGKIDKPIEVTLPNRLSPYFKVRDFGRGLTEQEIGEVYAMYGESTKRGTNEQIGQLGLGSKSAFAYGDNFVINSFVKGVKTSYNAFIDDTQIGQICKLTSEKSNSKDGIEITIPVKEGDFNPFREKALSLFSHFKVRPNISGADQENFYGEDIPALLSSEDWTLRSFYDRNRSDSVAIMGNIAYPLSSSSLDIDYRSPEYCLLNEVSTSIYFNIGDLEISASREALQYTDETKATILKKIKSIIKEIPVKISDNLKACKNLYQAKCIYGNLYSHGGLGSSLKTIIGNELTWNGVKINDNHFTFPKKSEAEVRRFSLPASHSRKKRVTADETSAILCNENAIVVIDDRVYPDGIGLAGKMTPLVKDFAGRSGEKIYKEAFLLSLKTPIVKKEFYKKAGTKDFKLLSDLKKYKLSEIYPSDGNGGNGGAKSSKHTTKEFLYDIEKASQGSAWVTLKSQFFDETSVDLDSTKNGLCIEVDKFYVKRGHKETHPVPYAKNVVEVFNAVGITKLPKVYAFKPKKYGKVIAQKNWTNLHDYIAAKVKAKFNEGFMQKVAERKFVSNLENSGYGYGRSSQNGISDNQKHWFDFTCFMKKNANMGDLNGNSPFAELFSWVADKFHEGDHKKIDTILNSCKEFIEVKNDESKTNKISDDFVKLVQRCINRYPLVRHFDHDIFRPYRNADKEFCKESINYMNVIDVTWKEDKKSLTNK